MLKVTAQETRRKRSNQPLCLVTPGPKYSPVSRVLPKRHCSTPSMIAPIKAASPRIVTATGKDAPTMSLRASKSRVTETMQARLIAMRTMPSAALSLIFGSRQLGRVGANRPRAIPAAAAMRITPSPEACMNGCICALVRSKILGHEADDVDHRGRGNRDRRARSTRRREF